MDAERDDRGWLVRLRWAMSLVQIGALGAASAGVVDWPLAPMALALAVGVGSNLALAAALRRGLADAAVPVVLLLDAGLLTLLLAWFGGASSALAPLYLVPPALAASLVEPRAATAIFVVTGVLYTGLLLFGPPPAHEHGVEAMRQHTWGMFAAWGVGASFVVYAIARARRALAVAEAQAADAREARQRADRLASLATLAAGASHELGTPLATILVAAREIARVSQQPEVTDDAEIIRDEVERCRAVLAEMSAEAGADRSEQGEWIAVADLLDEVLDPPIPGPIRTDPGPDPTRWVRLPVRPVVMALRRLVGNACDAKATVVHLRADLSGARLTLSVADDGGGMDAAALARAKEPFYTTKPAGRGLGLYYVDAVTRSLGGGFTLTSQVGVGTTATIVLPDVPARADAEAP